MIDLFSIESKRSNTPVGQCKYYNINNNYEEYDEIELNETTWCYRLKKHNEKAE